MNIVLILPLKRAKLHRHAPLLQVDVGERRALPMFDTEATVRSSSSAAPLQVKTPPAPAGLAIGLMGGSFNPPHVGHLQVARTALKSLRLDHLWWIVTPGNPLKAGRDLAPLAERMDACRALIGGDPRMVATSFETELGNAYSVETIAFLQGRYPATHFVWVMGADNLATFHRWRRWREIAARLPIAVVDRPGWHLAAIASPAARALAPHRIRTSSARALATLPPPAWTFLSGPLSPASSTALRAAKYAI